MIERLPEPVEVDDEWSLDANRMVAVEGGLVVPETAMTQPGPERKVRSCFCGNEGSELFRGWWLCALCAGPTKRRWRRANRKPERMAIPRGKR